MSNGNGLHVVFGTGPVGLAIMHELRAKNKRVRMVNRNGKSGLPEGVELVSGDASDKSFARQVSAGATVVYQALNPPYDKWPELFPPLQEAVIDGAAAAGARLVSMENVYMYGSPGGKPMNEDMPYAAHTRKGQVRATMAEDLMAAHKSGRVEAVIGRASDFYGPNALLSSMGERVFRPALEGGSAQVLGNPDAPHTYTYVPDIGKALVILGERDEAVGQAWHIPSDGTLTTRQFIDLVYEESGYPAKIQSLPKLMMRAVGIFDRQVRELVEMWYEFEEPFVLDYGKFEKAFGGIATPIRESIQQTLDWYRQNPA